MSIVLDSKAFYARVKRLIAHMKGPEFEAKSVLITTGSSEEATSYSKSIALQTWLLGYEFPDTLLFITLNKIYFVTSQKKANILSSLVSTADQDVTVEILVRTKDESQNSAIYQKFIDLVVAASPVGVITKDSMNGKFANEWKKAVEQSSMKWEQVDCATGVAVALAKKDSAELDNIKTAAKLSSLVMQNYFVPEMSNVVDSGKKVTHEGFTMKIENVLIDEKDKNRHKLNIPPSVSNDFLDWCYPPIIQSGGKYDLRPSASSNSDRLHEGTIVCSLGVRYKSYCSNVSRTFLMNPEKEKETNYKFLEELQMFMFDSARAGITCSALYQKAVNYIQEKRPDLRQYFLKNCGFLLGIEFRESQYLISPKSDRVLEDGMVINLVLGFQNIEAKSSDSKSRLYSLLLADTIQITDASPIVFTDAEKGLANISYTFGDDDEEENDLELIKETSNGRTRGAVLDNKTRGDSDKVSTEEKRKLHQKQLAQKRHEEGLARYSGEKSGETLAAKAVFKKFEAYRKEGLLPRNISDLKIIVDRRAESVVLPIYGQPVPFHISTLKNVTKSDEQDAVLLRFNFNVPGQSFGKKEAMPFEDPNATFVRSLSYRSTDVKRLTELAKEITDLKKDMLKREAERLEMADLVEQATLIPVQGRRPPRLPDVFARPGLEGKRFPGDLEIHVNGLRYQSQLKSDQKIDLLFSNIQHLFFQPCDGELIVVIHVHLKNPIMIGKKKTKDVQFYREVSDASFDETGNRRRRGNYGDEDELAQEQEERRRRAMLNREFQQFSEKIHDLSKGKVDVDIPFRELGFQGVPFRQLVLLQPTTECLVHLSDTPFLVISLADVEVAHLERVQFGLKNFDLVFVFKDFKRPVVHVNTIPINQLENVKEWLDSVDIPFSEGPVNLSWPQIMKTINEDPKSFFEEAGGWSFLQGDGSDAESDGEPSESDFEMEQDSSVASSESDSSDYESEDSESDGSEASGSDEESGKDWDEMEAEAEAADKKKRAREEDSMNDPRRKHKKGR